MRSNTSKNMSDLVVKSNRLNTAIQNLSLAEIRLIQLAIIDSRESVTGLTSDSPLRICAKRYAEAFEVEIDTAYDVLLSAEATLFDRRFTFINERENEVKTRWVSQVEYIKGGGALEIIFTPAVVKEITRINGIETFFTKYLLGQTAALNSVYSVRLYELLAQWREAKKTSIFDLEVFRGQLGLGVSDYKRMCDFKRRVLDSAVDEINEKTDLKVSYEQVKKGRTIIGFKFKVLEKPKFAESKKQDLRDKNTLDIFHKLTDKQVDYFGSKLAYDSAFGAKYAKIGESPKDFEYRIKQNLIHVENQQKWMLDLMRLGYKVKDS